MRRGPNDEGQVSQALRGGGDPRDLRRNREGENDGNAGLHQCRRRRESPGAARAGERTGSMAGQ